MVLGFTKTFGRGKKTLFKEKILSGAKIHTIRIDGKDRWTIGKHIHFATGARTSKYDCFKEGTCYNTQKIRMIDRMVEVDGQRLTWEELEELAKNDGFDSLEDFWMWFDRYTPFDGKIIHWTNKIY